MGEDLPRRIKSKNEAAKGFEHRRRAGARSGIRYRTIYEENLRDWMRSEGSGRRCDREHRATGLLMESPASATR